LIPVDPDIFVEFICSKLIKRKTNGHRVVIFVPLGKSIPDNDSNTDDFPDD
jgi:hypothetical protein